ncbi:MAG TPA: hypothetical protein VLQ65_12665, partial [Saliniramus sp.]|nr:hypothetical protein [Saliniramus sp.]
MLTVLRSAVGFAIVVLLVFLTGGPGADAQDDSSFIPPGTYDNVTPQEPQQPQQRPIRRARTAPAPAVVETPAPAAEVGVSARVVVFGDSLAHNLGSGLQNVLDDAPEIDVSTQATGSSGLVRDDFHDWPAA